MFVKGEGNLIFCSTGSQKNYFRSVNRSVGKIIITILCFRIVCLSTQAFKSVLQHTLYQHVLKIWKQPCLCTTWRLKFKSDCDKQYVNTSYAKSDQILLLPDSSISKTLNFVFYIFYYNVKGKYHIRRKIDSKKKYLYGRSVFFFISGLPKFRVDWTRTTKNYFAFA